LSPSLGRRSEKSERKKGAKLIYLSPYSPDFSPIENLWSKLKIILRSLKTTNYQELGKAIEFALGSALHRQIFLTGLHTAVIVPHLFEKGYIKPKIIQDKGDIGNFTRFGPEELVLLNREGAYDTKEEGRRKKEEVDSLLPGRE
jgi:hypothetical protein